MKKISDHKACLVVFCKRPDLFQGKQRLAATIGPEVAFLFAQSLLNCALEDASSWTGPVVLSPAAPQDCDWAKGLLDGDYEVLAQPDGNLGTRLKIIDHKLRAQGHDKIIFMGTDAPMLTAVHFEEAKKALNESDVILSFASDGGVTLMGARIPWPDMTHLPWSTDLLGVELENICCKKGLEVAKITPSYDVDVEADLLKLKQDLENDSRLCRKNLHGQINQFFTGRNIHYG